MRRTVWCVTLRHNEPISGTAFLQFVRVRLLTLGARIRFVYGVVAIVGRLGWSTSPNIAKRDYLP